MKKHKHKKKSVKQILRQNRLLEEQKEKLENSKFILDFLKGFPKDANTWGQATDELPDLHSWMADRYNEDSPEKFYRFDFENRSWTPAVRNTRHREGIQRLLQRMDTKQIADTNERFRGWLLRMVLEEQPPHHSVEKELKDWTQPPYLSKEDWNDLKKIKKYYEAGEYSQALEYAFDRDTIIREAIPPAIWLKIGGELTATGKEKLKRSEEKA